MAQLDTSNIAAASITTPSTGVTSVYTDATTKRLATKNDAGVVSDYADLTSTQTLAGKTLTTPNIGAATGTSLAVTGTITSSGTAGIGYATGAGAYTAGDGLGQTGTLFFVNVAANGGIEISADALQLKSSTAGNGLSYSSGVLTVGGTADRITVGTDTVTTCGGTSGAQFKS